MTRVVSLCGFNPKVKRGKPFSILFATRYLCIFWWNHFEINILFQCMGCFILGQSNTQQKNGYNFEIFITLMFKLLIFKKQVEHMYFIILSLLIYVKCTAYELLVHIGCIHQLKKYYAAKFHRCCNIGYPFTNEKYFYCYLLMVLAWCSVGLLWNKASNLLIRQIDQDLWRQRGTTDPCYWT